MNVMVAESSRVRIDGVTFHVRMLGSGSPLLLLHGFTGSSCSWFPVIDALARGHRVIAIDLIGHGMSDAPPHSSRYDVGRAVEDLAGIATHMGIDRAAWLGYSMGGRLALGFAVRYPSRVSALVLESATAGIRDGRERAVRRRSDQSLANRIEQIGTAAFVAEWESAPMWHSQQSVDSESRRRLHAIRCGNQAAGLANSLRGMGQGAQPALWDRLGDFEAPVLLLAGAADPKFSAIASRMHAELPHASIEIAPETGHCVHLERPESYVETVESFLARGGSLPQTSRQEVKQ